MAASVEKYLLASVTSVLTTTLNALANNAYVLSGAFDNTIGAAGDGYTRADLELFCNFAVAPVAGTGIAIWFLQTQNGTDYEDGGVSVVPSRPPDLIIPLRSATGDQRIVRRVLLPWGAFKVLLKNDNTGQAMAATLNTLKIRPATREVV